MEAQIFIVILLTFVINLITTLSYSVRLVGIRTGRIVISFSLFNILILISRTANGLQAPLLANTVEKNIHAGILDKSSDFHWIILSSTIATIVGGFLIPTFHRLHLRAVENFSARKSVPSLIAQSFTRAGITQFRESIAIPTMRNITQLRRAKDLPWDVFFMNLFSVAIFVVGVLSALYAGYLNPELRTTSSSLSAVINGVSTILMFIFIDPYFSALTDDVILGKVSQITFRRFIIFMIAARVAGTLLAQVIFFPAAEFIAFVARHI